jgi:hypothetical protein
MELLGALAKLRRAMLAIIHQRVTPAARVTAATAVKPIESRRTRMLRPVRSASQVRPGPAKMDPRGNSDRMAAC